MSKDLHTATTPLIQNLECFILPTHHIRTPEMRFNNPKHLALVVGAAGVRFLFQAIANWIECRPTLLWQHFAPNQKIAQSKYDYNGIASYRPHPQKHHIQAQSGRRMARWGNRICRRVLFTDHPQRSGNARSNHSRRARMHIN